MKHTVVGVDIAKRVFQLYWVEMETGAIVNLSLKREKFLEHFANRAPCRGRRVKPFVGGNKNDTADARAIWTAVQQPGMKSVAVKSEAQQAVLALHRMRSNW